MLGHETMLGHPSNVPSATGAAHPVILGKIVVAREAESRGRRPPAASPSG